MMMVRREKKVLWAATIVAMSSHSLSVSASLADRSRVAKARKTRNAEPLRQTVVSEHTVGDVTSSQTRQDDERSNNKNNLRQTPQSKSKDDELMVDEFVSSLEELEQRELGQLTGCCSSFSSYSAEDLCAMYGQNCESGQEPSHDSGDDDCSQEGLAFIGISFSVNTPSGNSLSYQLNDQMPLENIIDRNYDYVMSMDEDGWLVGGGYKSFDYSGKMPYIDSSHTELLRIGSIDPDYGGTSIEQVYSAMESLSFPPFSIYPEYVKGGGGHHSGDGGEDEGGVPSGDVTLVVSVVDEYDDDGSYSSYDGFLDDLFDAMEAVGGGPCMDDHDTDPHVSMARGVKFKSSYHQQQYYYEVNLEVAVWQAMYPKGVVIGSSSYASFPPDNRADRQYVGYGNLYFFFDRANITKAFPPNQGLSETQEYYATLYSSGGSDSFYSSVTTIDFDYSGSHDDGDSEYEHNPYNWNAKMANHDFTDGWDLPPNCEEEGETFFGIPLSRNSDSKLTSSTVFQTQFDFEYLLDRNFTYMKKFGTNHGWLAGERIGNGAGSIVDKDTAHIPIFYTGTTNPNMGGMSLSDMVKIAKQIDFGTLYIKPAFVFQDEDASIKIQFEADPNSALGYLYDNLCKMMGIEWNGIQPSNDFNAYTNCAMHAAGDRASYGCGPDGAGTGGFCPQMTLAYSVGFQSEDHAAAYFEMANTYIDYWRSLYPSGVAVGTSEFCPEGGCLGLYLNRYDLFQVYKPDLGGSWVEWNGGTAAPTVSPAPTWDGGCDNPHNSHLDKCFKINHPRPMFMSQAWSSLGPIGQFSVFLLFFMATTLTLSLFITRLRKKKKDNDSHVGFFMKDMKRKKKKRKTLGSGDLEEDMLPEGEGEHDSSPRRHSRSSSSRSKDKRPSSRTHPSRTSTSKDKATHSSSSSRARSKDRMMAGSHDSRSLDKRERSRTRERSMTRERSIGRENPSSRDSRKPRSSDASQSRRSSRKPRSSDASQSTRRSSRSSSRPRKDSSRSRRRAEHFAEMTQPDHHEQKRQLV